MKLNDDMQDFRTPLEFSLMLQGIHLQREWDVGWESCMPHNS